MRRIRTDAGTVCVLAHERQKEAAYSCGDDSDKSRQSLTHLLDKELFVLGGPITFP
jgi:hypothetical protein